MIIVIFGFLSLLRFLPVSQSHYLLFNIFTYGLIQSAQHIGLGFSFDHLNIGFTIELWNLQKSLWKQPVSLDPLVCFSRCYRNIVVQGAYLYFNYALLLVPPNCTLCYFVFMNFIKTELQKYLI